LLEQYDSVHLLAAALKLLTGEKKDVEIELTPEEPIRAKKRRPDVRSTGRRISYGSGEQRVDRFRRQRDGKDYRDHRDFARDRRRDYDGGGSSRSKGSGV
jgi:ATP-dependent RNA helicase DeaD